jgi:hypothetical protein
MYRSTFQISNISKVGPFLAPFKVFNNKNSFYVTHVDEHFATKNQKMKSNER